MNKLSKLIDAVQVVKRRRIDYLIAVDCLCEAQAALENAHAIFGEQADVLEKASRATDDAEQALLKVAAE